MDVSLARAARVALAAALVSAASGCDAPGAWVPVFLEGLLGSSAPSEEAAEASADREAAASAPAQATPATATPAPGEPAPLAPSARRYAGGRPIAWWSERLARLRREGPEDLYRLTVERARLNGLEVVERDGGAVEVATAPAGVRP